MGNLAHNYELSKFTFFHDDGPKMIQDIFVEWNPMLMNENVLWGLIPTLPKFLAYERPSNIKSLVKSLI
jgi:hypothetical protein